MVVRDLLDLMVGDRKIFIKPSGRRTYYEGYANDAPESLMDAIVIELCPKIINDDPMLGIWIDNIEEWDWMVDGTSDIKEFPDIADAWYYQIISNRDFYKQDIADGIKLNREERKDRYWKNNGERKPSVEEIQKWIQEEEAKNKEQLRL